MTAASENPPWKFWKKGYDQLSLKNPTNKNIAFDAFLQKNSIRKLKYHQLRNFCAMLGNIVAGDINLWTTNTTKKITPYSTRATKRYSTLTSYARPIPEFKFPRKLESEFDYIRNSPVDFWYLNAKIWPRWCFPEFEFRNHGITNSNSWILHNKYKLRRLEEIWIENNTNFRMTNSTLKFMAPTYPNFKHLLKQEITTCAQILSTYLKKLLTKSLIAHSINKIS